MAEDVQEEDIDLEEFETTNSMFDSKSLKEEMKR